LCAKLENRASDEIVAIQVGALDFALVAKKHNAA
jgi:hypothetical protein